MRTAELNRLISSSGDERAPAPVFARARTRWAISRWGRSPLPGVCLWLALTLTVTAAPLFRLSDSDPNSPEFRRRFMASYGVNAALEPKLTQKDRPLYERIAPLLEANPQEAVRIVEAELTADANPAFLFLLGNLKYQVNDFAAAEDYLRRTVDKFPSFRRAHRTLALSRVQQNRFAESVASWLQVISLGGGDAQSYGLLAYAYLTSDKHESALAAYRMARMFDPDSVDFKRGQAECLYRTRQHLAAIALFDELLAEHPEETDYWVMQANAYHALGRHDEMIANLEVIADAGKGTWDSLILLGNMYLDREVHHLALDRYKRALRETTPGAPAETVKPLRYLLQRGLHEPAKDYLVLLKERVGNPGEELAAEIRMADAEIEMELGDAAVGKKLLEEVLVADPLNGRALLLLGRFHQNAGNLEEAELQFERATSVPQQRVEAHVALARLAVERGKLRDALEYLRQASEIRPAANLQRYMAAIQRAIDAQR